MCLLGRRLLGPADYWNDRLCLAVGGAGREATGAADADLDVGAVGQGVGATVFVSQP